MMQILIGLMFICSFICGAVHTAERDPKIYTFYNPGKRHYFHPKLLDMWKDLWDKAGFEAVILDERVARKHEEYGALVAKLRALPSVNPKWYEMPCFTRHLAMAVTGGGYMVDYDVLPLEVRNASFPPPGAYTVYGGKVPCYVGASGPEYLRVVRYMANLNRSEYPRLHSHKNWDRKHSPRRPHVSDQTVMHELAHKGLVRSEMCVAESPAFQRSPLDCAGLVAAGVTPVCRAAGLPIVLHFCHDCVENWGIPKSSREWMVQQVFDRYDRECRRGLPPAAAANASSDAVF